jgi:hypothetical protein
VVTKRDARELKRPAAASSRLSPCGRGR